MTKVANEFSARRQKLRAAMAANSMAIIPSAPVRMRNNDVEYPFRPNSDLYYLTGFAEPETVAVITNIAKAQHFILFNRERDAKMETWHGRRAGQEGACAVYGADQAFAIAKLDEHMLGLLQKSQKVYYALGAHPEFDIKLLDWLGQLRHLGRSGVHIPVEFIRLDHLLHEQRLRKSTWELRRMRRAAQISAAAHRQAMRQCKPELYEYQIEALLQRAMLEQGCQRLAYPSIVAAGANACVLHYTQNNAQLKDNELLLIDAGGEWDLYAADITRTFPINGRFNKYQGALYNLVLKANLAAIAEVKIGKDWNAPHRKAVKIITEGLVRLGILKGKPQKLIKDEVYKTFFMHRTGHWLGMDVHDVGAYKSAGRWRKFEQGMVLTVEPGIYIAAGAKGVAKKWWNIGIRIEDDVLVTVNGPDVLSKDIPKSIAEIEQLMCRND